MTRKAITVSNVTKKYGDIIAVDNFSLTVESGELFGLIGPDGAGKTTMMQILCGLRNFDSGNCTLFEYDCERDLRQIRKIIGYMPQRFSLYPDLTVAENLKFFADLFHVGREERMKRTDRLLAFNNLSPFKRRKANDLSGGMKQKLALSCTLIHTPRILILDEPTTGVDPVSRREFWDILYELRKDGVTILVSTPYMDEAQKCDRIAFMHMGKLMATDKPEDITAFFTEDLYELVSDNLYQTYLFMQNLETLSSVQLFGDKIHFVTRDIETLKQNLAEKSIDYSFIKKVSPTIEDIFIELMKKQD